MHGPRSTFSSPTRGMLTRKCRGSLTCYSLLRCCNRTKSSAAPVPKFERDAVPHAGLPPRPDSPPPRRVTSRPVKERERQERERRGPPQRSQLQNAPLRSQPSPTGSTRTPPTAPVHRRLTIDDFFHPLQTVSNPGRPSKSSSDDDDLPSEFTSPPLLPALRNSLFEKLGPFARPTPIQSLSLKYLLQESHDPPTEDQPNSNWRQFFLASETGSGKSIAYLLPLLQSLKHAELAEKGKRRPSSDRLYNPRALILAPTHELGRQLSGFAKSLLHELKLKVLCASQANIKNTKEVHKTSRKMGTMFDGGVEDVGEFEVSDRVGRAVDVMVGTPMKLLELVRGRGWDRIREEQREGEYDNDADEHEAPVEEEIEKRKPRRGREFEVGFGRKATAQLGLQNVEWVIIDEADVLLDSDFQATTLLLLSDISAARGHPIPLTSAPDLEGPPQRLSSSSPPPTPISYLFNFILTSATIPNSLNNYLQNHHPSLIRLSSPHLHHLPKSLAIEYVSWSGGNKFADIHRRIRQVWSEDAATAAASSSSSTYNRTGGLSKVLIFCNRTTKAIELSEYLEQQHINCVPMTSASKHRVMGTNRHLFGFLKQPSIVETVSRKKAFNSLRRGGVTNPSKSTSEKEEKPDPLVMVTTSLLSRGLDFSPEVKHVFIVDEPRNMVDFLHRAGRSGRAGQKGKVVVFGKLSGRGSERGREVKKKVVKLKLGPPPPSLLEGSEVGRKKVGRKRYYYKARTKT